VTARRRKSRARGREETVRRRATGDGLDVVWRQFVVLFGIGAALFAYALARFRATIGTMV
jgi:hypothetical protein